jgi:hypothetical protein
LGRAKKTVAFATVLGYIRLNNIGYQLKSNSSSEMMIMLADSVWNWM